MARISNKFLWKLATTVAGGIIGYHSATDEKDRLLYTLAGMVGGNLLGELTSGLVPEQKDTRNYNCYQGNKLVYTGICYNHRRDIRMYEHERSSKQFTHVKFGPARTRSTAILIERQRIIRMKPIYNIQHKG